MKHGAVSLRQLSFLLANIFSLYLANDAR